MGVCFMKTGRGEGEQAESVCVGGGQNIRRTYVPIIGLPLKTESVLTFPF